MSDMRGAHIEIVDPKSFGDDGAIVPTKVLVNGVDVGLVAQDGVHIGSLDGDSITTVTFTLFPSRVTIRGAENDQEFQRWNPVAEAKAKAEAEGS